MSKQILKVIALIAAIASLPTTSINAMDSEILVARIEPLSNTITNIEKEIAITGITCAYLINKDPYEQAAQIEALANMLQRLSQTHKNLQQILSDHK